ncbi:zinc finger BED domain-containing protein 1-like [Rhizophagus clarus]|uniref:Zinc finger BED domain-containing protein 1-like n=1 Tax=Rhizophagus clarus TaxID=94130 RepID=A0A8H3L4R3_9GLOM|nr:zinc finger BED domain-containing protein 1-like [Rhizophagus clarus]
MFQSNSLDFTSFTHTLQLVVGKGLLPVELLIARTKRLINFFTSLKQIERLLNVQKNNIPDSNLQENDETKKENENLREIFYKAITDVETRWSSTFNAWYHLIQLKQFINVCHYSTMNASKEKETKLDAKNLTADEWECIQEMIDVSSPFAEITERLEKSEVKINLYNVLERYHEIINNDTLVASLLDPRWKNFSFAPESHDLAILTLKELYEREKNNIQIQKDSHATEPKVKKRKSQSQCDDPLEWWYVNQRQFPILAQLARKYIAVQATPAASEHVLSDTGLIMTAKSASMKDDLKKR